MLLLGWCGLWCGEGSVSSPAACKPIFGRAVLAVTSSSVLSIPSGLTSLSFVHVVAPDLAQHDSVPHECYQRDPLSIMNGSEKPIG